jgi:hypothetical protein
MAADQVQPRKPLLRRLAAVGEILTVLGPIAILGLWFYQQVAIEQRSSELRRIASAHDVFQTYQSNNALFNAINEMVGTETAQAQVRRFQVYNYELGLRAIENVLAASERSGIPPAVNAFSGEDVPTMMVQRRLELLQRGLADKESMIQQASKAANTRYLFMYVVITVMSICGSLFKVVERLSSA